MRLGTGRGSPAGPGAAAESAGVQRAPFPPPHRDVPFAFLAILAGVLARLLIMAIGQGTLIDDAYITLRYGRNLMEGDGLVYNVGERVLGTQPLYALWTGVLWKLSQVFLGGRGVEVLVTLGNVAFFAAAAALVARWIKIQSRLFVHVPLVVLCSYVPFLDNTTTGMETSLFLFLIAASLDALHRDRRLTLSILLGLCALTRPEGNLWALAVILYALRRRRPDARLVLPFLLVVIAWGVFAWQYYGTPLPLSARAKSGWFNGIYANEGFFVQTLDVLASFTLGPWPDWQHWRAPEGAAALAMIALLVLFGKGALVLLRTRDPNFLWSLFFLSCVVFFVAGRGATWPSWYAIPPGLGFVITLCHGADAWIRPRLPDHGWSQKRVKVVLGALAFAFLVISILIWNRVRLPYYLNIEESYVRTGKTLAGASDPGDRLFVVEIGCIGYYADRYVYDLGGLISPEIQAMRRIDWGLGEAPALVQRYRPEWVVVNDIHLLKILASEPEGWFEREYRLDFRTYLHFVYRRVS